jgi:hypothetical protein
MRDEAWRRPKRHRWGRSGIGNHRRLSATKFLQLVHRTTLYVLLVASWGGWSCIIKRTSCIFFQMSLIGLACLPFLLLSLFVASSRHFRFTRVVTHHLIAFQVNFLLSYGIPSPLGVDEQPGCWSTEGGLA